MAIMSDGIVYTFKAQADRTPSTATWHEQPQSLKRSSCSLRPCSGKIPNGAAATPRALLCSFSATNRGRRSALAS
jgi:hypothetical protein